MSFLGITNNDAFYQKYSKEIDIEYFDVGHIDILMIVRDKVHMGYEIVTHPISGSVKPNETPFKTIFMKKGNQLNYDSLMLIENSIVTYNKFVKITKFDSVYEDFKIVDLTLAESALKSILAW